MAAHEKLTADGGAVDTLDSYGAVATVTEKVFTTYDVQSCLFDTQRVEYLWSAIRRTVREGDVVVDAGSGTGLLGLLAARQGAAKVYCLEINPEFIEVIEQHAARNGLSDRVVAVRADASTYTPEQEFDVLISEVISGGFFYEPQLQILNNLHRYLRPGGRVVPMAMNNHLELISAQDTLYGLRFDYDSRFNELAQDRSMSTVACYLRANFLTHNSPEISGRARVRATASGAANALRVSYDIDFAPGVSADKPTQFLLNPQVIYLPEPVDVTAGREYDLFLDYHASDSPLRARIEVRPAD